MVTFEKISNDKQLKTFAGTAVEIWHECFKNLISYEQIDYMVSKFQSYQAVKEQIADGYEYYFILKDGVIAGYLGICPFADYILLSKLYIKNEYRKQGLGRAALQFAILRSKELKYIKIRLTVNKHNDSAIHAYEKWGFERIDSVAVDIGGGFVMDDYIYEKKI